MINKYNVLDFFLNIMIEFRIHLNLESCNTFHHDFKKKSFPLLHETAHMLIELKLEYYENPKFIIDRIVGVTVC